MLTQWEYAAVHWKTERRKITKADPEYHALSHDVRREWEANQWAFIWWYEVVLSIELPGEDPQRRLLWQTGDDANSGSGANLALNEMGKQGWEVVAATLTASAVAPLQGWEPAGYPIHYMFLLKRPIEMPKRSGVTARRNV